MNDFAQAIGVEAEGAAAPLMAFLATHPAAERLLRRTVAGAPFLRELIRRDPLYAAEVVASLPEPPLEALCAALGPAVRAAAGEAEVKGLLRRARARAALLIALADIAAAWDVERVTAALTSFADCALNAALDWLLAEAHRTGKLTGLDPGEPGRGSGFIVLAMGKHGAGELNYSSDIDLIVLYDPETAPLAEGIEAATFFVRLTRRLVALLQDITADGYVFRVDLRLRPDPRATQIAIALEAAALYYENMGQNWERAAMIKARPAAGDLALGAAFLDRLAPYIWRKHLDFAAIADVQSLKRQIHAHKGHAEIKVLGHNLKLGRGGIREIEFFVQTQQLIAGGRNPMLRGRRTVKMLEALAAAEWITPAAAGELKAAYRFLRRLEHRLQMVADEQTQSLPEAPQAFARFARFAGFADAAALEAAVERILRAVQGHYAKLFEQAPSLGAEAGDLAFTGAEDDPETLRTLRQMGFERASEVAATIRGWHFGRYPATRSARARERLTEIMPALLAALARSGQADRAFLSFDAFLRGLPTGVQLFSLLRANPNLLDLLATILGTAPRLAEALRKRPKTLDVVLDQGFFGALPDRPAIEALVAAGIDGTLGYEATLDRARVLAQEQMFRIGVRVISDTASAAEAGAAYSALAEALTARLLAAVEREVAARHGRIAGGRTAVVAMGKLGGREMTAASDLDLIVIYDHAEEAEASVGAKPLAPTTYYTRLTQRLISALSAPTVEGGLYAVDLRLRPSGNKGPVATRLSSFIDYHKGSAWTWEKLALSRARVVAGERAFRARVEQEIQGALCAAREIGQVRRDVIDMRRRMLKEFGSRGPWDLKHARGGLVDIEFIAQFLQIAHAAAQAGILDQNTAAALHKLEAAGLLAADRAHALRAANRLFHALTQVLRLCVAERFEPATAPDGLKLLLARAGDAPDLAHLEAALVETQSQVVAQFEAIVGPLAAP